MRRSQYLVGIVIRRKDQDNSVMICSPDSLEVKEAQTEVNETEDKVSTDSTSNSHLRRLSCYKYFVIVLGFFPLYFTFLLQIIHLAFFLKLQFR